MKRLILSVMVTATLASCAGSQQKALILYYSQTGTTEAVALELQRRIGADTCRFDVVQSYTGTYEETIQRCIKEREEGFVPDLSPLPCDLSGYDIVFLGYPVWFGTYAPPVQALLRSGKLDGKTIVPFCTFGSGGIQSSTADLRKELPQCDIRDGYGVRSARISAAGEELNRFLIEQEWKEGYVEPLPEFSQQTPVSDAQRSVFSAACSGYKYPIGTPVTAGERTVPGGKEYLYSVDGLTADGRRTEARVYIIVMDGQQPVFTQVIR